MTFESTLPSAWYLDEDIYALEREHIFMREWLCVAREEELSGPGDHRVLDLYGESILLLRNTEGELRAFYNVCRHRGARLCASQPEQASADRLPLRGGVQGNRSIMCPYHAWSYDLDGRLQRTPHLGADAGLNREELSLHPVALACWGGFVFVNLSPESAEPLHSVIASTIKQFQRYPMEDLRVGRTIRYEVAANWKVICENYNECYHCGPVHPELCEIVPVFKQGGGAGLDWERGIPHREGAVTFTATGTTERKMFPGLNADEQLRHKGDLVYPNLFLSASSDHVAVFILHATGPNHTGIDCHFLFHAAEMERPEFDPADAADFWHVVNRQDWSICERVQQGMGSRVHDRGIFSPMEDWNLDIRRYVTDRIGHFVT
jgi:phenylpropionate dioxygenase-like ring-hydroxylating dioxygenase large terminal subunit